MSLKDVQVVVAGGFGSVGIDVVRAAKTAGARVPPVKRIFDRLIDSAAAAVACLPELQLPAAPHHG